MLRGCMGEVMQFDNGVIEIMGIDKKLYVGEAKTSASYREGDSVYFEYCSLEEKDGVNEIVLRQLRRQSLASLRMPLVN